MAQDTILIAILSPGLTLAFVNANRTNFQIETISAFPLWYQFESSFNLMLFLGATAIIRIYMAVNKSNYRPKAYHIPIR